MTIHSPHPDVDVPDVTLYSYGQISDTDYRTAQPANGGDAAVVELVPRAYA